MNPTRRAYSSNVDKALDNKRVLETLHFVIANPVRLRYESGVFITCRFMVVTFARLQPLTEALDIETQYN